MLNENEEAQLIKNQTMFNRHNKNGARRLVPSKQTSFVITSLDPKKRDNSFNSHPAQDLSIIEIFQKGKEQGKSQERQKTNTSFLAKKRMGETTTTMGPTPWMTK